MSTYTQILYQIVFATKNRKHILAVTGRRELFNYIYGILKNKNCHVYRINGVEDHLHILIHLHPSVSLASLVKDIKLASSEYIKKNNLFPGFGGWQEGYGAFTYCIKEKGRLINYIKNQEIHHQKRTFKAEYSELLNAQKIEFNEKYMF